MKAADRPCQARTEKSKTMTDHLSDLIDTDHHRLTDNHWLRTKKEELAAEGAVQMQAFLTPEALARLQTEAEAGLKEAYFKPQSHNIYLDKGDEGFSADHVRNRRLISSKGCITDDQIAEASVLKQIYHHPYFIAALCFILGEDALYPYADSLSSVNIHYARHSEELNWHFDNSSFAVTLMIQPARSGGAFEYVRDVRNADKGEMGFDTAAAVLEGRHQTDSLSLNAGDLLLFRGRNSLHRVTPVGDDSVRHLAVLAYNSQPGVSLSETAQMTFYGRVGQITAAG